MSPRPVDLPEREFAEPLRLARQGRRAEAIEQIERSLASAADREAIATAAATALAEIAQLAEAATEFPLATRALERALEIRPRFSDLHFRQACLLLAQQRRAEARHALEEALRINPRYVAARIELAMLDARDGLVGESLAALAALADDARIADPRAFQQGLRSLERAEWDEADSLLRRALHIADPDLHARLAEIRAQAEDGDAERTARSLREALRDHPGYPDLHDLLGVAELQLGHLDDAASSFARALELNPEFHDARVHLAQALEALGHIREAHTQLQMVMGSAPAHAQAAKLKVRWAERGVAADPQGD